MRRMFQNVCILTFVAIWNLISSVDIKFTKYEPGPWMAGYRCIPNETAFEAENIPNYNRCSFLCHLNRTCVSFVYNPDSKKCIGCRVNLGILHNNYESYLGSQYFYTKSFSETNCKEILENHPSAQTGPYKIRLRTSIASVYCDMDTDGGGWTVFQNRFNMELDFNRNFSEYENGFGAVNGQFWLGLKIVQEMTSQNTFELRLEGQNTKYFTYSYQSFSLDKSPEYTLRLGKEVLYTRPNGVFPYLDGLFSYNDGKPFSTYDVDQDSSDVNCASTFNGGWWYNDCSFLLLNGRYAFISENKRKNLDGYPRGIGRTKMMFR